MNGTAHMIVGASTGFAVAYAMQADPTTTIMFVGLGGVTALIPDMDTDGKLSNKITFSYKFARATLQLMGVLILLYSFLEHANVMRWIGAGLGVGVIILASFLTQRMMLTLTGIGVVAAGIYIEENWILLLGVYMILASFVAHRSYTHSIIGVLFFGIIAYQFEASVGIEGMFLTCMLGYISHLITDMKVFPFNKRGVRWFLPFSKKEF
ncbi:metal-dependent hydrolase [Peribacillus asahii]|uniref:Hydrolase n=1 Tax=Peribacillus asahii TaxID=228899 RepID=A0A3T0KQB4_9BACI|nr:metal-dependent hydrolase [Peribacillus asahii]AZV42567.1 hydrolase [Peribacillus asahii]USK86843.1 metal-dependent hydrolase [Peribacillus asahii]